jgi:hypothetical protein
MNRHQRRAEKAHQKHVFRKIEMKYGEIDSTFDIQVEGKFERVVFVCANSKGRNVVEDLWPDIEWSTDEVFAQVHDADWRFAHMRVTRLPPHFEAKVPLAFASPDALGVAVASVLHRRAWPLRVAYWTGQVKDQDVSINTFGKAPTEDDGDYALFAEYMAPGLHSEEPDHRA